MPDPASSRIADREGKCFGRSAVGGPVRDCARPPKWLTVQENGANPIVASWERSTGTPSEMGWVR